MPTSDELLRAAITSFQAGQLENAERQFRELLAQDGRHLAGLNLLGMVLTTAGKFDDAERTIKAALAVNANSDATHYNLGIVLMALKRPAEALASFDRAIAINPSVADSWSNRAKALNALGRHEDAIGSCDRALQIDALSADAWNARGVACNILKRFEEALAAFNRAAGLKPDLAEAWVGLGGILSLAKDSEKALTAYDKALALTGDIPAAWLGRALSLAQMKRKPEAIAAYRDAVKHGVDAGQVALHLAALGAEPPPAATPASNVVAAFDQYAETFDRNVVEDLKYRIPVLAAEALKRFVAGGGLDILDLGCGTGLAGEQLVSFKRTMTGVDLSPKMLEKAQARGVYDKLVRAEIVQFLDIQTESFDVVVSADVFIYIGDLVPVFAKVRRALRDNGLFCFSIEASPDKDYVLRESFRFAHSVAYIERLARQNRFAIEAFEPVVVRQDGDSPIDGYLAVLRLEPLA